MKLALFDLDGTLIDQDCDYLWGEFLCELGVVDRERYQKTNADFFKDYHNGRLNMKAYLNFCLKPLADNSLEQLNAWREQFCQDKIFKRVSPQAIDLVQSHLKQGDKVVMITATNRFITTPIADFFKMHALIATEPELKSGRYTGHFLEPLCFREGKIECLQNWLDGEPVGLKHSIQSTIFYSDSPNDLPLLNWTDEAVVVGKNQELIQIAQKNNWQCLELY